MASVLDVAKAVLVAAVLVGLGVAAWAQEPVVYLPVIMKDVDVPQPQQVVGNVYGYTWLRYGDITMPWYATDTYVTLWAGDGTMFGPQVIREFYMFYSVPVAGNPYTLTALTVVPTVPPMWFGGEVRGVEAVGGESVIVNVVLGFLQ